LVSTLRIVLTGFVLMGIFACAGARPNNLGVKDGRLAPCRPSPNCVSSDAADAKHSVAGFQPALRMAEAWTQLREVVGTLPRTEIISETTDYLHVECRSAVFGFIDDLELHARPAQNLIAVRSAARLGYTDFGVNRRRVEDLRTLLLNRSVIRPVEK
jgi:uncharacterized protein (DUF1499 family)